MQLLLAAPTAAFVPPPHVELPPPPCPPDSSMPETPADKGTARASTANEAADNADAAAEELNREIRGELAELQKLATRLRSPTAHGGSGSDGGGGSGDAATMTAPCNTSNGGATSVGTLAAVAAVAAARAAGQTSLQPSMRRSIEQIEADIDAAVGSDRRASAPLSMEPAPAPVSAVNITAVVPATRERQSVAQLASAFGRQSTGGGDGGGSVVRKSSAVAKLAAAFETHGSDPQPK